MSLIGQGQILGGYTDPRGLYGSDHPGGTAMRSLSLYEILYRIVLKHVALAGASATWVVSASPEDLGIKLAIGISRGGETLELDFWRIVSMLEKQGTFDLDFSEVEQYVKVTCALLPPPRTEDFLATASLSQAAALAKMQQMAHALQQSRQSALAAMGHVQGQSQQIQNYGYGQQAQAGQAGNWPGNLFSHLFGQKE